ncbi:hypothetical protein LshimejAT787_0201140 [Lyophyllum shimeji]|uniref:Uncharacterized protein n=1 Tax=Lyophyllum shimeji TaxID=47721 RepID=A0A9P3PFG8_LYOSH|nr:hypothetical protein LshimejAT787_0201140 [Lyophyllum shimeji]
MHWIHLTPLLLLAQLAGAQTLQGCVAQGCICPAPSTPPAGIITIIPGSVSPDKPEFSFPVGSSSGVQVQVPPGFNILINGQPATNIVGGYVTVPGGSNVVTLRPAVTISGSFQIPINVVRPAGSTSHTSHISIVKPATSMVPSASIHAQVDSDGYDLIITTPGVETRNTLHIIINDKVVATTKPSTTGAGSMAVVPLPVGSSVIVIRPAQPDVSVGFIWDISYEIARRGSSVLITLGGGVSSGSINMANCPTPVAVTVTATTTATATVTVSANAQPVPSPDVTPDPPKPECSAIVLKPWTKFSRWKAEWKSSDYEFDVNYDYPTDMTVTDDQNKTERYEVFVDGVSVGKTSDVATERSKHCGLDADACIAKGWAHGTFRVPAGKHKISIKLIGNDIDWSSWWYFAGQYKIAKACT